MKKIFEQTMLYDFYGEMLNEHQKKVFEDAVFNDLSLSEIADEYGISRQAAHNLIKRVSKTLTSYEEKLHMIERFNHIEKLATHIIHLTDDIMNSKSESQVNDTLTVIRKNAEEITDVMINT